MKKALEVSANWFLLEVFPGQEKCSFHNSSGKNSPNLSLFPKSLEMIEKSISSSKKFYRRIVPQDTENALLTLLPLSFFLSVNPSSAQSPQISATLYTFQQNRFSSKCLLDTRNGKMTNYAALN